MFHPHIPVFIKVTGFCKGFQSGIYRLYKHSIRPCDVAFRQPYLALVVRFYPYAHLIRCIAV